MALVLDVVHAHIRAQVKVNYHGTVDGKIFDSSVDKDWLKSQKRKPEPIVFKVPATFRFGQKISKCAYVQVGTGLVIRGVRTTLLSS